MLYPVKYKNEKFKVTFKNKIKIDSINFLLHIKRIVRRARIFIPHNLKMYALLTICWILYGILIYFWGQIYIKAPKTYGIYDVIWDLKSSYFTSVILAIFIGGYNQITNYKEKIAVQHDFYTDTLFCFDKLFYPFLGEEIYQYCAFYNDLCLDNTLKHISKMQNANFSNEELDDIIEDILIQLEKIDDARKNNRIIGMHKEKLKDYIDQARKTLNKCNKTESMTIEDIQNISFYLFHIIADIRRPWRWDIDNNVKILKYLNENEDNGIDNHFYYNMHLNGHKFS